MERIRKGDKVVVISGANKGQTGNVLKMLRETDRVLVEGVNRIKRHQKPTPHNPEGGIIEKEAGIHISNVMLVDDKDKPTRVRFQTNDDGDKVRVAVTTGKVLD